MQIDRITVTAGRTLPHPLHQFANIKCEIGYSATLDAGEDADAARRALQSKAESDVENHANELKESIRDYQSHLRTKARIESLESQIKQQAAELDELRKEDARFPLFAAGNKSQ